ncbi:glycosyltransferase family 4 protein [Granulicella sp. dw_53]|uniref:glycosyltransferase family 4 protein n=1 Tax=Granulicella sp. dw_53 TaxID=2719792 RepID=UPI001BD2E3CB|nr:glycosyltransferase family 4 protein [Granulicella sp. dw_53]
MRRIVLGHPFGNENVRQALVALSNAGVLESFVTTICAEHVPFLSSLPGNLREEIERRSFKVPPSDHIKSHPFKEVLRLLTSRVAHTLPAIRAFGPTVDDIWQSLDVHLTVEARRHEKNGLAVYAYEDGALSTFSALPGVRKIYELPIGYWKSMHRLFMEERTLNPDWAVTLAGLSDPPEKLKRKDAELELSDQIIVPSEFVKSTLPEHWAAKANIVQYGCPSPTKIRISATHNKGPLRALFCGSLGQRKGISYLFNAIERMGRHVELTVIGSEVAPCPSLQHALEKTTWHRSLPHARVLELMQSHDVLVFPTLFEGRALVVLEALSQGLPVITTAHSGATDVVISGQSGFLIPIRSTDAIVEALETLYDNRDLLDYMKEQARVIAAATSWESYRANLLSALALT